MLSYLLNKTYEDDMTKCLLISAIAKINSNINFSEQNLVNDIIERYSRDKNVELQQRCLEYKRTQLRNVPIQKNSFTKIEENPNIDFNLNFLDDFVKEKGGKKYDPSLSDMYMDKFSSNEVQLNVGPYAINEGILSMPSKGNNINSLYDTSGNYLMENMKSELSVKGEQKWGEKGYQGETKKEEKPSFFSTQGISSSSQGYNTGKSYENSNFNSNKGNKRLKKEEELNPESQEKKQLMKELFGGMSGESEDKPKKPTKKNNENYGNNNNIINNNKGGMNLFEGMTQVKSGNSNNMQNNQNQNNIQNNTGNFDLLGFGENQPQQSSSNNNAPGSIDLLGEIFGGGGNTSNNNPHQGQQNQNNIFEMFGSNSNNQNNIINNNNISNQNNNNMNFFEGFNSQNSNMNNNNSYSPYNIDTDKFGELWEKFPEESTYEINANISSPQQYHEIIKNKGNYAAIDIINNEAISAASYKNQISLVHCTIDSGHLTLLVKNQNQSLNEEVANYVMGLFK